MRGRKDELAGGHRPADEEPLSEVTAHARQERERGMVFDALGDHAHLEGVAELDGGSHQGEVAVLPVGGQVGDETRVMPCGALPKGLGCGW